MLQGLLMKAKKDYVLGLDVRPDDVLYTYTTVSIEPHSALCYQRYTDVIYYRPVGSCGHLCFADCHLAKE